MKFKILPLSSYLKDISENLLDHSKTPPDLMYLIHNMDDFFRNEVFIDGLVMNPISSLLCMNALMQFNASTNQALSGHVVTVFPIVRSALEAACYAFIISQDDKNSAVWYNRNKSEEDLKKCRVLFTVANCVKFLKKIDVELAQFVGDLYTASIDFGAHPNPISVMTHLDTGQHSDDDYLNFSLTGIYGVNSWEVNLALLACLETGHAIAFLTAASCIDHPVLGERSSEFQNLINLKNEMVNKYGGKEINCIKSIYASVNKGNDN
jgi:hypothetical protein